MTSLRFEAMPEEIARALRSGANDANGQSPERQVSDGRGNPTMYLERE